MKIKKPRVGDELYIESHYHISHGRDDVTGGLAKISNVEKQISAGEPTWFVEVEEVPGDGYNYELLMEKQEELKKEFGKSRAHPSPDIDTPWIEEGDIVSGTFNGKTYNGEVYQGPPIW